MSVAGKHKDQGGPVGANGECLVCTAEAGVRCRIVTLAPYRHLSLDEIQARYTALGTEISNALEEQHQLCEELMSRSDQSDPTDDVHCGDDDGRGCNQTPCLCIPIPL